MKNKKVTILLLTGVALLWGIIIFRMVKVLGPAKTEQHVKYDYTRDTTGLEKQIDFKLALNYPDPFLRKPKRTNTDKGTNQDRESVSSRLDRRNSRTTRERTRRVRWPKVQYGGIIRQVDEKDKIALIQIGSKDFLMKENEENEDITLVKIYSDSIKVEYKTETMTIVRNEQ